MKILHIIFSFQIGGAETMLVDILNEQLLAHEVGLLIINDIFSSDLLENIDENCCVFKLNRKKGGRNILDVWRLNKYVYKFHPDIIHCHDSNIIKYLPIRSFKGSVLTVHDTKLSLDGILKYDSVIAISKAVFDDINSRKMIVNCHIIHNGIKTNLIQAKHYQPDFKTVFRIVQVSRLDHQKKGQHLLLRALYLIKQSMPNVQVEVDLIGEGSSLEYLKQLTVELDINSNTHFLGLKDRSYIYSHLKEYDLLVQPSINEGFGLTIIEGMTAGLPVLVSDSEGPAEVIQNGNFGYMFHAKDVEDLAKKIVEIMMDVNNIYRMALKGREYALGRFDISTQIGQYEQVYQKLLK